MTPPTHDLIVATRRGELVTAARGYSCPVCRRPVAAGQECCTSCREVVHA